jgi:hypothetical protein
VPHVFVETNWLFACVAPAHHQVLDALELLDRAKQGEFTLHLPNVCIGEARRAVRAKCQPRTEAKAIRQFLEFAASQSVSEADGVTVRTILDKYESSIKNDLDALDHRIRALTGLCYVNVFALDEDMLARTTELALAGVSHGPFDQAVLASVLVGAERLWESGDRMLSFCELDSDLQPWGRSGETKPDLTAAYDRAHVWVYGDFKLNWPKRPPEYLE